MEAAWLRQNSCFSLHGKLLVVVCLSFGWRYIPNVIAIMVPNRIIMLLAFMAADRATRTTHHPYYPPPSTVQRWHIAGVVQW